MIIIIIVCLFFLCASCYLYHRFPLYTRQIHQFYDACIVLGSPANADGSLSYIQKQRMDHAIALYREKRIRSILISGAGVANTFIEAEVMKDYAIAQNVPEKDILLEKHAKNTYENLKFATILCREHHFSKLIIVTSGFHIRRAGFFAKKFFTDFTFYPVSEKEKRRYFITEYLRMWNTLYYEWKLK